MADPMDTLDDFDVAFRPYLPLLGAVAVYTARIEFDLALLNSILTNKSIMENLKIRPRDTVKEIKGATGPADGQSAPEGVRVCDWASRAEALLARRGKLMHSMWSVDSDIPPDDLVRIGWLTEQQAAAIDPKGERAVYSRRLRGDEPPARWTRNDLGALASELRDHLSSFRAAYEAARGMARASPTPDASSTPVEADLRGEN